jgi:hypothetical protein
MAWSEDEPEFVCGAESIPESYISATDPLVVARIVFVGFPNEGAARQELPAWGNTFRAELADFINVMSRGQQNFDISIVTRPDDPTKAWIADSAACDYDGNWGELNTQIMERIALQAPGTWSGVEQVFIVHYSCVWNNPAIFPRSCGVGGVSGLGLKRTISGFTGGGTTQKMLAANCTSWPPINNEPGLRQYEWNIWVAAHEYGHRIPNVDHPPHSRDDEPPVVDYGHYDVMNGNSGGAKTNAGLKPYHDMQLVNAGWLPLQTVLSTTLGLALKDVCNPTAVAYRVNTPDPKQYFFLVNHQASSYDVKYGASGLLIWHILEQPPPFGQRLAWDLEAAGGKRTAGIPDPACGQDLLEEPGSYYGTGADLFNEPNGKTAFGPATNPNTFLYSAFSYTSCQTVPTSISFENIERDAATGNMLVDVYLEPIQFVTFPDGGETLPSGNITVNWRWRDPAISGISTVDVRFSADGGATWPLTDTGKPNTGSHTFTGLQAETNQARMQVISYDASGNASDMSNADFTVWNIVSASITPVTTVFCHNNVDLAKLDLSWQTSIATDAGGDKLEVWFPNHPTPYAGTPSSTTTGGNGSTSHQLIYQGPCQTGWHHYRFRSMRGTGEVAKLSSFYVASCPSCSQCPPPGCDLE